MCLSTSLSNYFMLIVVSVAGLWSLRQNTGTVGCFMHISKRVCKKTDDCVPVCEASINLACTLLSKQQKDNIVCYCGLLSKYMKKSCTTIQ